MRKLLFSLICAVIVFAPLTVAFSGEDDLSGFSIRQLNAALRKSGVAAQKLYSIQTFDSEERDGANTAILSGSNRGWRVLVLHRVQGGLAVEWNSGELPDDFVMSSSRNLKIDRVGDEQVVTFSGCAAHQCGVLDGVFGFLLYSPQTKQTFFAHYRYDERKPIGSFGSIGFSRNANEPGNERYKSTLQNAITKVLHR